MRRLAFERSGRVAVVGDRQLVRSPPRGTACLCYQTREPIEKHALP